MPTRRHAANEDAGVARMRLHADAVAENRTAGERAGGIDGDDAHAHAARAQRPRDLIDQRALAGAGRPGDAQRPGAARAGIQRGHQGGGVRRLVLDETQGAGKRTRVSGKHTVGERNGLGHGRFRPATDGR